MRGERSSLLCGAVPEEVGNEGLNSFGPRGHKGGPETSCTSKALSDGSQGSGVGQLSRVSSSVMGWWPRGGHGLVA